jgi:3-phosphoshikimate 1-carboxyvinyltransferase
MPLLSAAVVAPARRVHGRLSVPGDKSISHRYAIVAALSRGTSRLLGFAPGADCGSTLACLERLGVETTRADEDVTIAGLGIRGFRAPAEPLDAGNSGTTMRMLAGILAGQPFTATMTGDASLSRRPMRRVMEPLAQMGARIEAIEGHAPLTVHGGPLHSISFEPRVPSAQVKSAVLLAGLHAEGTTSVVERVATRDHTERALAAFGFGVRREGHTIAVGGGGSGTGHRLRVPGDFSSAAFWMAAAAALPGSRVEITGVGLNPTRTALVSVLRRFGARVDVILGEETAGEPIGTVIVEGDRTEAVDIGADEVPLLIDELPAVAALASHAGEVSVRGAEELRVKESDRIAVLVRGFRALGIDADERPDGFVVHGAGAPQGGVADASGDHRMAMAFAIAALAGRQPSRIEGADSVVISYPGFFDTLQQLVA